MSAGSTRGFSGICLLVTYFLMPFGPSWLSWVTVMLNTAKNGWPSARFFQWALPLDSFQSVLSSMKFEL